MRGPSDSIPRRVAIVGTGISGLALAHVLQHDHDITLFEAADYVGGHTHTIEVDRGGERVPVDTGFIVYNEPNYPNFSRLLRNLGIATQATEMGFSVTNANSGLEYSGNSLRSLFAQPGNLVSPSFHRMLVDVKRFYREAPELLISDDRNTTLGEYLTTKKFSREFIEDHLIPFGAAIWSAAPDDMYDFPAQYFVRFFDNHGFLQFRKPPWRVISHGSHTYVKAITRYLKNRIRLKCPVYSVRRKKGCVDLTTANGVEVFDAVVLAVHSDQALRVLSDPTEKEREILGGLAYQKNEVVLHTDVSLLPARRRAWASWNYHVPKCKTDRVAVTYNMNILQSIEANETFCVTLNRSQDVNPDSIIRELTYHHPKYTVASLAAQSRYPEINGTNRTYYCGAYWGYGFHEDGVNSAIAVAKKFGKEWI